MSNKPKKKREGKPSGVRQYRLGDGTICTLDVDAALALPDQGQRVLRIIQAARRTPEDVARDKFEAMARSDARKRAATARVRQRLASVVEEAAAELGASWAPTRAVAAVKGRGPGERFSRTGAIMRRAAEIMYRQQQHPFADEVVDEARALGIPLEKSGGRA